MFRTVDFLDALIVVMGVLGNCKEEERRPRQTDDNQVKHVGKKKRVYSPREGVIHI